MANDLVLVSKHRINLVYLKQFHLLHQMKIIHSALKLIFRIVLANLNKGPQVICLIVCCSEWITKMNLKSMNLKYSKSSFDLVLFFTFSLHKPSDLIQP